MQRKEPSARESLLSPSCKPNDEENRGLFQKMERYSRREREMGACTLKLAKTLEIYP